MSCSLLFFSFLLCVSPANNCLLPLAFFETPTPFTSGYIHRRKSLAEPSIPIPRIAPIAKRHTTPTQKTSSRTIHHAVRRRTTPAGDEQECHCHPSPRQQIIPESPNHPNVDRPTQGGTNPTHLGRNGSCRVWKEHGRTRPAGRTGSPFP